MKIGSNWKRVSLWVLCAVFRRLRINNANICGSSDPVRGESDGIFSRGIPSGHLRTLDDSKHWKSAAFSGLVSPGPNRLKSKHLPPN